MERHGKLARANEKLDLSNTESKDVESVGQVYNSIIESIEQRLKNIDDRVEEVKTKIVCVQAELDAVEGDSGKGEKIEKMREEARIEAKKKMSPNNSPKTATKTGTNTATRISQELSSGRRVGRDMNRNSSLTQNKTVNVNKEVVSGRSDYKEVRKVANAVHRAAVYTTQKIQVEQTVAAVIQSVSFFGNLEYLLADDREIVVNELLARRLNFVA